MSRTVKEEKLMRGKRAHHNIRASLKMCNARLSLFIFHPAQLGHLIQTNRDKLEMVRHNNTLHAAHSIIGQRGDRLRQMKSVVYYLLITLGSFFKDERSMTFSIPSFGMNFFASSLLLLLAGAVLYCEPSQIFARYSPSSKGIHAM